MSLEIEIVPCLQDNYAVLVHEPSSKSTLCVDAPDPRPIQTALAEKNWQLNTILVTHRHGDHTAGLDLLKSISNPTIYGPAKEAKYIPQLDNHLEEGDTFDFAGHPIEVLETPGHTKGHISYHWPDDQLLFSGDTLFALGCGRIFEGSAEQMWASLSKLATLPKTTQIFCGHEYTLTNAEFAAKLEPSNIDLQTRLIDIRAKRAKNEPTLPSTLELELKTNPFLRPSSKEIRNHLNLETAPDVDVFAAIRTCKDQA